MKWVIIIAGIIAGMIWCWSVDAEMGWALLGGAIAGIIGCFVDDKPIFYL